MGDTNQNQDVMDNVKEYGQAVLNNPKTNHQIHLLNVIGEIEGHENLSGSTKTMNACLRQQKQQNMSMFFRSLR